jgi:hypothetical protein
MCVPTTHRTATVYWSTGMAKQKLAAYGDSNNWACFLQGVQGSLVGSFASQSDTVQVYHDTQNWYIGGTGNAEGWGACVSATSFGNIGTIINNGSSTYTWNMTQAPDTGTNPLGMQCMLTGLGGAFTNDDTSQSSGIKTQYTPATETWSLIVGPGLTGYVNCVQ